MNFSIGVLKKRSSTTRFTQTVVNCCLYLYHHMPVSLTPAPTAPPAPAPGAPTPVPSDAPTDEDSGINKMSAGMGLFMYGVIAFLVVIALFLICTGADAMGRYSIAIFKRFMYTDGVGNVSLLTEIIVFLVVLIVVAVILSSSFQSVKSSTTLDIDPSPPSTPLAPASLPSSNTYTSA